LKQKETLQSYLEKAQREHLGLGQYSISKSPYAISRPHSEHTGWLLWADFATKNGDSPEEKLEASGSGRLLAAA
jgi:hypothetical protein